jgi:plastocyanin
MWALYRKVFVIFLLSYTSSASGETVEVKVSADGVQRSEIIVDSYSYKPDRLVVTAKIPVELTLKSVTLMVPHNFVIEAKGAGMEVHEEIPAGKTITVRLTPTQSGEFKFFCDKRLLFFKSHEARGMVGTLEVREGMP